MSYLEEGMEVRYSGVGSGKITGFSERGYYPQVNEVTVSALELADGQIFNPHSINMDELRRLSQQRDADKLRKEASDQPKVDPEVAAAVLLVNRSKALFMHLVDKYGEYGIIGIEDGVEDLLENYVQYRIHLSGSSHAT